MSHITSTLRFHYDDEFDILYTSNQSLKGSVGDEDDNGFVVFRNRQTGEVTGLTIFDFATRRSSGELDGMGFPPEFPYGEIRKFVCA